MSNNETKNSFIYYSDLNYQNGYVNLESDGWQNAYESAGIQNDDYVWNRKPSLGFSYDATIRTYESNIAISLDDYSFSCEIATMDYTRTSDIYVFAINIDLDNYKSHQIMELINSANINNVYVLKNVKRAITRKSNREKFNIAFEISDLKFDT